MTVDKPGCNNMSFGINGFFTTNFFIGNKGNFAIKYTYILYLIEVCFRIHNPAIKYNHIEFS